MLEKVTWPLVVLVLGILASVVTLGALHVDTGTITQVLMLLGLGGGLGVLTGIKNNVNGNLKGLVDLLGSALDRLAKSTPLPDPPAESDEKV